MSVSSIPRLPMPIPPPASGGATAIAAIRAPLIGAPSRSTTSTRSGARVGRRSVMDSAIPRALAVTHS